MISKNFELRDFVECGDTFERVQIDNSPQAPASKVAIAAIASEILEPVTSKYGRVQLTYGLATRHLLKHISRRIAPRYDQHAAHELNSRGNRICIRDGFAVDFKVKDTSSLTIAKYIAAHLPFDRLYYYGPTRPIHVSYGPDHSKKICIMNYKKDLDRWYPRNTTITNFLNYCE